MSIVTGCAVAPEFVTPAGGINHVYAVIDVTTETAIRESAFLAAVFTEPRDEVAGEPSERRTSGLYLAGRETMLSLFSPSSLTDAAPGRCGLGVGLDNIGATAAVRARYRALTGLEPIAFARTRRIGAIDVPWFLSTMPGGIDLGKPPAFLVWAMEYQPAYFVAARGITAGTARDDITRRRYYARHFDASRLLRDVVGLTFDVPHADGDAAIPLLEAAGFAVARSASRAIATAGADIVTLNLVTGDAAARLREIVFALNRDVAERHVETLGNSQLIIGPGRRAVWQFSPVPELTSRTFGPVPELTSRTFGSFDAHSGYTRTNVAKCSGC